jgi:hypothetical protein
VLFSQIDVQIKKYKNNFQGHDNFNRTSSAATATQSKSALVLFGHPNKFVTYSTKKGAFDPFFRRPFALRLKRNKEALRFLQDRLVHLKSFLKKISFPSHTSTK